MQRFAASIQYNGSKFHGWQILKNNLPTVQFAVEKALSKVANHIVTTICAGRTDAGVHATSQIVHFDSSSFRSDRGWVYGVNANLDNDIALNWVKPVDDQFHARFSALWRRYCYIIYNSSIKNVHNHQGITWNYRPLNILYMQQAADYLLGEHDFTSYRTVHCQSKNAIRTIRHINIIKKKSLIIIDIQANAFLHHMIRNIVGVLMSIGSMKQKPIWAKTVLDAKDRKKGATTAPPYGLYFTGVGYSDNYQFPNTKSSLDFILNS